MHRFLLGCHAVGLLLALTPAMSMAADCVRPQWPSIQGPMANREAERQLAMAFRTEASDFIRCSRKSVPARVAGLQSADVAKVLRQIRDEEREQQALAEALPMCLYAWRANNDSVSARASCDLSIRSARRALLDDHVGQELQREEFAAYGGSWSYRLSHYGNPGHCDDAPCPDAYGIEVTNFTPVALACEISLAVKPDRLSQTPAANTIALVPGDSLLAVVVRAYDPEPQFDAAVSCQHKLFPPPLPVAAECSLQWEQPQDYPAGLWRRRESGIAVVDFTLAEGHRLMAPVVMDDSGNPYLGEAAIAAMSKSMRLRTNCPAQRFRLRIEFRSFAGWGLDKGSIIIFQERD